MRWFCGPLPAIYRTALDVAKQPLGWRRREVGAGQTGQEGRFGWEQIIVLSEHRPEPKGIIIQRLQGHP
ncbi:hypothetical protein [Desulforamulus hydrothermalis]|uniref:hypothetical protein n=1 Tax=Desulforamulus hydrothermalis TaxID=412895 RepID=UPI0006627D92|nr:hypothetical protein [Desulforamulus hydrothermalis]